MEDVRHKDWAVLVKTKLREVFDIGIKASHDDEEEVNTYLENVSYNITTDDACDDAMTTMLGLELTKKEPFMIHR